MTVILIIGPALPDLPPIPRTWEVDGAPEPLPRWVGLLLAALLSLGLWGLIIWGCLAALCQ